MCISSIRTHWWYKHIAHLGSEKSQQAPLSQPPPTPLPLLVCSSFFPCEHWCLLQVMNASSLAHWVLTLLNYSKLWRKKNLEIEFGIFFLLFFKGNSWPSLNLLQPPCHSSYMPLIPSSHLPSSLHVRRVKVELLMITLQTSVPSSSAHTLTPYPPQASFLFPFLSFGSHMNDVVPRPELGQGSNGEAYCAVKVVCKWPINNQRSCISGCKTVYVEKRGLLLVIWSINTFNRKCNHVLASEYIQGQTKISNWHYWNS